jgi:hypothetical protein
VEYRATLGHKLNHSFKKDKSRFVFLFHPRFGDIVGLQATDKIFKGLNPVTIWHLPRKRIFLFQDKKYLSTIIISGRVWVCDGIMNVMRKKLDPCLKRPKKSFVRDGLAKVKTFFQHFFLFCRLV